MDRRLLVLGISAWLLCLSVSGLASAVTLQNPDFSFGLASWQQELGTWTHIPGDGIPGPGGTAATTSPSAGTASLVQCVGTSHLVAGSGLALRSWVITADHSSLAELEIELFSGPACSGGALATASDALQTPALAQWNLIYTTVEVPAVGASSALVRLSVTNDADGELTRFDAVRLEQNLVANAHFSSDLSGWLANTGSWTRVDDGLSSPPGAARAVAAADGSAYLSQCANLASVPVSAGYLAMARGKAESVANEVVLVFHFFEDALCSGTPLGTSFLVMQNAQVGAWETFATNLFAPPLEVIPPADASSVGIFIALDPGDADPGDVSLADDIALVPSDILFTDGFETGDSAAWSASAP